MSALVASTRAELLRLRRWPAMWVLLGVWVALNVTFGYVFDWIAFRSGDGSVPGPGAPPGTPVGGALLPGLLPPAAPVALVQGMPVFGGALVLVLGALAVGSGFGWGTWKTVFTQGPGRGAVIGGTLTALAVVVTGLVLVTAAVDLGASVLVATVEGQPVALPSAGDWAQAVGTGLLVLGTWAMAGVLVGVLTRSPALAVGLGLVWALVVETLLRGVGGVLDALTVVTDHLPGTAAGSLVGALSRAQGGAAQGTPGVLDVLSGPASVGWLAGYLVGFTALAVALMSRRDVA